MPSLRNLVVNPDARVFWPSRKSDYLCASVEVDGLVCYGL